MDLVENEKDVRKLRKKLRQIENLERLSRRLTDEELNKIQSAEKLRQNLQSKIKLIKQDNSPASSKQGDTEAEDDQESLTIQEVCDSSSKIHLNGFDEANHSNALEESLQNGGHAVNGSAQSHTGDIAGTLDDHENVNSPARKTIKLSEYASSEAPSEDVQPPPYVEAVKRKKAMKQSDPTMKKKMTYYRKYGVEFLDGHNDIIFDLSISDNKLASASRDSLVKVWNLDDGNSLLCTLSGHAEAVNCVEFIPKDKCHKWCQHFDLPMDSLLLLSGGQDSCVRIWSVSEESRELLNVYTFTPINCLVDMDMEEGLFLLGTSGGKLELWNLMEKRQLTVETCFTSAVSDLKCYHPSDSQTTLVAVCSEKGQFCVFSYTPAPSSGEKCSPLRLLYTNENGIDRVESTSGANINLKTARSVTFLNKDTIILADGGVNLKLLSWTTNTVQKVANCPGEYSVTDAVHFSRSAMDSLLYTSGLSLETDCGTVNLLKPIMNEKSSSVNLQHIGQLRLSDFGHILCISSTIMHPNNDKSLLVTGGSQLAVWQPIDPSHSINQFDSCVTLNKTRHSSGVDHFSTEDEDEDDVSEEDNLDTDSECEIESNDNQIKSSWRCSIL